MEGRMNAHAVWIVAVVAVIGCASTRRQQAQPLLGRGRGRAQSPPQARAQRVGKRPQGVANQQQLRGVGYLEHPVAERIAHPLRLDGQQRQGRAHAPGAIAWRVGLVPDLAQSGQRFLALLGQGLEDGRDGPGVSRK